MKSVDMMVNKPYGIFGMKLPNVRILDLDKHSSECRTVQSGVERSALSDIARDKRCKSFCPTL